MRPIVEAWQAIVLTNDFGIIADDVDKFLRSLKDLAENEDSDLLVLYDDNTPVGYLGLQYFSSPLGNQRMANEHYFFVMPEHRGISSMKLIRDAKMLAKAKGCSHLIMNASNLASDMHDKVCEFYKNMNMKLFESSYISEV